MFMQTVNRTDTERVWVTVTNNSGHTLTTHFPVFKYSAAKNASSVSTNEAGLVSDTVAAGEQPGACIGLAYEDIPNGEETGIVQVYGYHESVLVAAIGTATIVKAGTGLTGYAPAGGGNVASVGLTSVNLATGSPAVAVNLTEITAANHQAAQGAAASYSDHVFLRAM
jgi:hypothetical protein